MSENHLVSSQLLSVMTHELRTPLHTILSMVKNIQTGCSAQEEKDYLQAIAQSSEQLLVMVSDILDLGKARSGKLQLNEKVFPLQPFLDQLRTEFSFRAKEKGLHFQLVREDHLPIYLLGDEIRLRQIIYNLCDNAVKYTKKGLIKLQVSLFEAPNQYVGLRIEVIDTGLGIPEDQSEAIFEAFTQIDTAEHREHARLYGGVGLGLSIVRYWIDKMGANITLKSVPNQGTEFVCEFHFKLPTATQIQQYESAILQELQAHNKVFRESRVLLVEDNYLSQQALIPLLKRYRCEVDVALDGNEALTKMQQQAYDIVFMDMNLPDMSGIAVTQQFRATQPRDHHYVIIALTANAQNEDQEHCLQAGMDGFLTKPIQEKDLRFWLERIVGEESN